MTMAPTPETLKEWRFSTLGCGCETCAALLEATTAVEALVAEHESLLSSWKETESLLTLRADTEMHARVAAEAERDQALARVAEYEDIIRNMTAAYREQVARVAELEAGDIEMETLRGNCEP